MCASMRAFLSHGGQKKLTELSHEGEMVILTSQSRTAPLLVVTALSACAARRPCPPPWVPAWGDRLSGRERG
jgi:hypothetical protein